MSNNLYIPYESGDTDIRPLPAGADFWSSPGVVLDSNPGGGAVDPSTYIPNNQQCLILVNVHDKSPRDIGSPPCSSKSGCVTRRRLSVRIAPSRSPRAQP
jgi:hypothetical protein